MSETAERMTRVDNAWLRMDNEVNLMMIVGVWLLKPALGYDALTKRIGDRLLKYPRFSQKVVENTLGSSWVHDEDFDIRNHVVVEKLPRKRGQSERAALQERCGELATTPLDHAHPLWQWHLVEHYEGGSAVLVRIHHCIGDGISLNSVVMSITDGGELPQHHADEAPSSAGWLSDKVVRPLTGLAVKAIDLSGEGVSRSMDVVAHPQATARDLAHVGRRMVTDLAALALMDDDSPTRLKGKPSGKKIVAWGEPIPLDVVRSVGKALDASINDVLLACVAGAIGDYLRETGDDPQGKGIRAMVPVNLRPLDEAYKLGNRFGLAPLVLPIGIDNPLERVFAVRAAMSELKGSYQPMLAFGVLAVGGLLNKPLQDALLGLFAKKATAVMTNVPGPAKLLKFCGSTLTQTIFWVPQSGDIGVGVSIFSYGGGVQFSLITDRKLCPQPQKIIDRFAPELDKLLTLTLMLPWGGQDPD
jgi:diacylglycerol O-acyltransferase